MRSGAQITGVQTNQGTYSISANGRVILAAGALSTPRILFQSGIGPADMIKLVQGNSAAAARLPPASEFITLPVGNNVYDHASINVRGRHRHRAWPWSANLIYAAGVNTPVRGCIRQLCNGVGEPAPGRRRTVPEGSIGCPRNSIRQVRTSQLARLTEALLTDECVIHRLNFWRSYIGSDGNTRYTQGTTKIGGSGFFGGSVNASQIFTITLYLTHGATSRGRVGIDSNLKSVTLTNPWFTDPVDKAVVVTAVNDVVNSMKQGRSESSWRLARLYTKGRLVRSLGGDGRRAQ